MKHISKALLAIAAVLPAAWPLLAGDGEAGQETEKTAEASPAPAADEPKTGTVKVLVLPGGAKMSMIYCRPGEFVMGSPRDEIGRDGDEVQHKVRLTKGFWLGKYEVTQEQWSSVMGRNPSGFRGNKQRPVDRISWYDCHEFVNRLNSVYNCGARLPTEAEWEYACRAGTTTAYSWGNMLNGDMANCNGDKPCGTSVRGPYIRGTTPVGHYGANPWGFCDMHGNVYEWCEDTCTDYPEGEVVDPLVREGCTCRVMRSGCWCFGARYCRSANRIRSNPSNIDGYTGFRLCCDRIPD